MDLQEFYLNQPRNHECIKLPGKDKNYLLKDNFLNEFFSEDDKAEARSNLGITPLLEELKGLITAKLFDETGNVTFDLEPHEDAYNKVLSSAALYRLFLNYYTKQELDSWKEDLREDFNTFKEEAKIIVDEKLDETSINPVENKAIALKLKEILTAYTTLFNTKADKDDFLNYYTIEEVEDKINEVLDNFEPNNNFTDTLNTTGATNTSDKIYLVGAKTLDENPQTYTLHSAYVGSDGCLYSGGEKVITDISNKIDKVSEAIENNFAVFDENGNLKDSNKNPDDFADVSHTHTISEIKDFPEFSSDINLNLEGLDDRVTLVENILSDLTPDNPVNPDTSEEPEYVEIGGLYWATKNIGAENITDTGFYFQWGDTSGYTASQVGSGEGQKYFGWEDYKYDNGTSSPDATGMTKYNATDGKTVLDASDDAAVANWGGSWRMPTVNEFIALGEAVTTAWTDDYQGSGVAGVICTDKADSSKTLFFPAAGGCGVGFVSGVGRSGYCWSTSLNDDSVRNANYLRFNSDYVYWSDNDLRYFGLPVRAVSSTKPTNNLEESTEENTLVEVTSSGKLKSSGKKTTDFVQTTLNCKILVIEEEEYNSLESYDKDTLYFVLKPWEEWTFGNDFPAILL